jgi:hypothetical protein
MYFHGEEQNISIRAYTHGWDIWHPNRVPLYHLYKKRDANEAPLHWDKNFDEKRNERWYELRHRANQRLAKLINAKIEGAYGTGQQRSIESYFHFAKMEKSLD